MKIAKTNIIKLAVTKGFVETDDVYLTDLQEWLISKDQSVWFGRKDGEWKWFADYGEYSFKDFEDPWEALEEGILSKLQEI